MMRLVDEHMIRLEDFLRKHMGRMGVLETEQHMQDMHVKQVERRMSKVGIIRQGTPLRKL
jgi:hypothetical protein